MRLADPVGGKLLQDRPVHAARQIAADELAAARTAASIHAVEQRQKTNAQAAADAEAVRIQRLREDAQRSLSVNLAEGIALSHKLLRFTGAALKN